MAKKHQFNDRDIPEDDQVKNTKGDSRFEYIDVNSQKQQNEPLEIASVSGDKEQKFRDVIVDVDLISEKIKLIYEKKNVTDPKKISSIKKILNEFGNRIPHAEIKDFADNIEILNITEYPTYDLDLNSEFEHRFAEENYKQYQGEGNLRASVYLDDINLWEYSLEIPKDKNREFWSKQYFINGSEETVICTQCGGNGKLICPDCQGKREKYCYRCNGRGEYSMSNGYYRCGSCGGRGWVYCSTCDGHGAVICPTCQGSGGFIKYITITNMIMSADGSFKQTIHNAHLPKEFIKENYKNPYYKENPSFPFTGEALIEIEAKSIPQNIFDLVDYQVFKKAFNDLYEKSKESSIAKETAKHPSQKNKRVKRDYRVLKQNLRVWKTNILNIEYKYNSKPYSLWLCGRDNVVFAPNSPFVEAAEAFLRKSKELLKTKKYDEAYGEVKKSSDILPQWKEQQLFEKKIRNKIRGQYVWGGVLGGTIFPVVGNILGFAIGEVFNKVFFLKIKVAKKRFLRPFYTSVVINSFLLSLFIFGMYKSPGFNNFVHMILGAVQHNAQTSEKNIALANKENKLAETQLTLLEKELSEIVARDKIDEQTVVTISEIVKLKKELYGTNSDVTAERIGLLGIVYRRLGRYEEAEKPSEDAMKIIEANHPGVENPGLGPLYCNLAIIKYELKKFPEAKEYAQKATKAFEALGQSDGIETKRMRKILDEIKKKRK